MKQLTAKDFKKASKKLKKLTFEELEGYVYIKKLKVGPLMKSKQDNDLSESDASLTMILNSVSDKDGNLIFETIEEVEEAGFGEFSKLSDAITKFNNLTTAQAKETEKN